MTENHEFNEIYEKYKNSVLRAAYLYCDDLDIAEDIRQDTFLKLLRIMNCKKLESVGNIESWLYVTAKNAAINYCKRIKWEVALVQDEESDIPMVEPTRESTEDEYLEACTNEERAKLHNRVMKALQEKNKRWYEAVLLEAHMGLPQKEAAEMMGVTLNGYQVMLHRARDWIRENYGVEYKELKRK